MIRDIGQTITSEIVIFVHITCPVLMKTAKSAPFLIKFALQT
jgi:hypothetical protein